MVCCFFLFFFCFFSHSFYIPSLNSFRFYSFSEALAHNIDADLVYIQYYCNGLIFYCCCYCRLCYFTFFFHLISCVNSSLAAISCSFYMLYSVVCVYIVVMSTDERTSKLNVTIFILVRLFNSVVFVCLFFFFGYSELHCRRIRPININLYLIVRWIFLPQHTASWFWLCAVAVPNSVHIIQLKPNHCVFDIFL